MPRVALLISMTVFMVAGGHPVPAAALCAPGDPVAVTLAGGPGTSFTEEPDAGRWRTWTVEPADLTIAPPPDVASPQGLVELAGVKAAATVRDAAAIERIRRWGSGAATAPWTALLLDKMRAYSAAPNRNPPRLSRQIAMFQTAMLDALVATWNAKYCYQRPPPSAIDPSITVEGPMAAAPSYPSEHAAVAGAASVLLAAFFPEESVTSFEALAWEAGNSRVSAGANYPSDVGAGLVLGRTVARTVLESRANDGWDAVWDGSGRIAGTCHWSPTPPAYQATPLEPMWGSVRPWAMSRGNQFRPGPPPACDGPEYLAASYDLYRASLQMTPRQESIAAYWAGGPGTETPPGMNLRIALDEASSRGLNTMRHARVLAYVGAALGDAAIAAWDAKFAYWSDRPVHTIRRLWDPTWTSYIGTPPFPGYVSGHSTFSGATAELLGYFFPDKAITFQSLATEAAMSRFYGGIHARFDNEVGLTLGQDVAGAAISRAANDRAG